MRTIWGIAVWIQPELSYKSFYWYWQCVWVFICCLLHPNLILRQGLKSGLGRKTNNFLCLWVVSKYFTVKGFFLDLLWFATKFLVLRVSAPGGSRRTIVCGWGAHAAGGGTIAGGIVAPGESWSRCQFRNLGSRGGSACLLHICDSFFRPGVCT